MSIMKYRLIDFVILETKINKVLRSKTCHGNPLKHTVYTNDGTGI